MREAEAMELSGLELGATAVLGTTLAWVAIHDWRTLTIPDAGSLGLLGLGLVLSFAAGGISPVEALIGAVGGYAIFALIGEVYFRLKHEEALGLGDAKLLGAAGAWLGWATLPALVATASFAALVFALVSRRTKLAFGPWLALAFWGFWIASL